MKTILAVLLALWALSVTVFLVGAVALHLATWPGWGR